MAQYRCAACGSKNVVTDTETGGVKYNYVKGAVSTVVLGVGGAAAGIENKTQQVYKCASCGLSLTYAMPEGLKAAIDLGVEDVEARNNLNFNGIPVDWDYLTTKYPNIERGAADVAIEKKQKEFATKEAFCADLLKKMIAYVNTPVEFEIPTWDAEAQKEWAVQYGAAWSKRDADISELLRKVEEVKALLQEESEERFAVAQRDYDALVASLADAEKELASLGFFKMKEKKALTAKIEELKQKIANDKPAKWKEDEKLNKLRKAADDDCQRRIIAAWNSYSGPVSPKTQFEVHKFMEPIRIKEGESEISANGKALYEQIKKAITLFQETHPFYIQCGAIPHNMRTAEQRSMVYSYSLDCECYATYLLCLLALISAKEPLSTDDLIDLSFFAGIRTNASFELDDRDSRANYRVINHALVGLTALGLAQTLCVTNTDIKPELHNNQYKEFRAFTKHMTATAKV